MQQLALVLLFVLAGQVAPHESPKKDIPPIDRSSYLVLWKCSLSFFLSVSAPNFFVRSPFEARKSGNPGHRNNGIDPSHVDANLTDIVTFQFMNGNHSITQSSFHQLPQSSFTVNNTVPLWVFCAQSMYALSDPSVVLR
ncbi:hypothetical protein B0H14DRAFT_3420919 [Mycena olivaceomarginata]|nr:hypothetical protein B0H14DRAFT_3420919 [Mycena olivaceomarginata]